ncbi:DUF6919 domain-containing protein [Actinomadura violacea]|uniref:DUF6919 domain-containing protein n=1 Tax=Actinomadura violacea TaxID=2819934 RepID=A0ABS3RXZ2_9ACTN|nr:hypothetical protein [Actinomadura violacea]MBO2461630.1 hypothetical protein [Actinomadura violacea]
MPSFPSPTCATVRTFAYGIGVSGAASLAWVRLTGEHASVAYYLLALVQLCCAGVVLYKTSRTARTRRAWSRARTLADLGRLTADWLEGRLPTTPTYHGPPDPETRPVAEVLARVNRAGYVTDESQTHCDIPAGQGGPRRQRDAVTGFCGEAMMERLRELADRHGLEYRIHQGFTRRRSGEWAITVSEYGSYADDLGRQQDRADLSWWAAVCSPPALLALKRAWQVTLVDPRWDRPGYLWRVLEEVAQTTGRSPLR